MKKISICLLVMTGFFGCLSSCATIFSGSRYVANVKVDKHPNASISYDGIERGMGEATFKVRRSRANNINIIVREKDCETQVFSYKHRKIQGWTIGIPIGIGGSGGLLFGLVGTAEAGSVSTGVGVFLGTLLFTAGPFVIADAITGAYWQPDVSAEKGVTKEDGRHYTYSIDYTGCKTKTNN